MKAVFFIFVSVIGVSAFAANPGDYVCAAPQGGNNPDFIAHTLNSMGCDNTKPFTVSVSPVTGYITLCCVKK